MTELEQRKLEAEIAHLQTQTDKAKAEALKCDADRTLARRGLGYWFIEGTKVMGAIVIGAGGVMAAFTGYQLTEVKKERMELTLEKLDNKKTETESALAGTLTQLTEIQTQVDTAQRKLNELPTQLAAAKAATSENPALEKAIEDTKNIQAAFSDVETKLRTASERITATGIRGALAQLSEQRLPAISATERIRALAFLNQSSDDEWTNTLVTEAEAAVARIEQRERAGIAKVGEETQAEINKLKARIAKLKMP